jgi:cyclophilin family peptidyl-prolyl cis-trans isomerase
MPCLRIFAALFGLVALSPFATAQEEGIFADFQTSMGNFTARLDYVNSPQTVANFIGLATGARPYISAKTGAVVTGKPYYDGLIFHRVISDFMIQGGCPLGTGSAGPGYNIRDEVANGLFHDPAYVLSMANSGPNTGGSQFFITVVPTPWLDGKHSIFGNVITGTEVVDAIKVVPVVSSKPVTDVVIQSVTIRRIGTAAQAFDIHAHNLPVCVVPAGALQVVPNDSVTWNFSASPEPGSIFAAYKSTDLGSWSKLGQIFRQSQNPPYTSVTMDDGVAPRAFYQLSEARHPGAFHTASGLSDFANRSLTVHIGNARYVFSFDNTGSGGLYTRIQGLVGTLSQPFVVPNWLGFDTYTPSPYGFQIYLYLQDSNTYWLVEAGYDGLTPTTQVGRHILQEYSWIAGAWQQVGNGAMSLDN